MINIALEPFDLTTEKQFQKISNLSLEQTVLEVTQMIKFAECYIFSLKNTLTDLTKVLSEIKKEIQISELEQPQEQLSISYHDISCQKIQEFNCICEPIHQLLEEVQIMNKNKLDEIYSPAFKQLMMKGTSVKGQEIKQTLEIVPISESEKQPRIPEKNKNKNHKLSPKSHHQIIQNMEKNQKDIIFQEEKQS